MERSPRLGERHPLVRWLLSSAPVLGGDGWSGGQQRGVDADALCGGAIRLLEAPQVKLGGRCKKLGVVQNIRVLGYADPAEQVVLVVAEHEQVSAGSKSPRADGAGRGCPAEADAG